MLGCEDFKLKYNSSEDFYSMADTLKGEWKAKMADNKAKGLVTK